MLGDKELKEVILKKELTDEEMLMVIQRFIFDKKKKEINIKRPDTIFRLQLMNDAYNSAVYYYLNDFFKEELL